MKYFLIAGEASGDQHAARLMEALSLVDDEACFSFLGGDRMEALGGKAVVHIREMAFMGFTQVLARLGKIRNNFNAAKKAIVEFKPDIIILVDYPGFNLRIAKWSKQKAYKVYYYIAPKVWAWNAKRTKKLEAYTDHIFSILPFEEDYFKDYKLKCTYVGNPTLEDIHKNVIMKSEAERIVLGNIALLPGSRKQEIERILPVMLSIVENFPNHSFVIAGMRDHKELYEQILLDSERVKIRYDQTLAVLNDSEAALVASGTATLETNLMGIPQVVCYITNAVSFRIARALIKVPYISLVNLILDEPAVTELIQTNCTSSSLDSELRLILHGGSQRERQLEIVSRVHKLLGSKDVSNKLSSLIFNSLKE